MWRSSVVLGVILRLHMPFSPKGKLSELLAKNGHRVKMISRSPEKLQRLNAPGAEIIPADIMDTDRIVSAFEQADGAYLLLPPNFVAVNLARAFRLTSPMILLAWRLR